jgi:cytochrome b involved in lipid metabolism
VYDVSKFAKLHPGGTGVLYADSVGKQFPSINPGETSEHDTAGNDVTQTFFGLHRHEILLKPQYARLQIGKIQGSEESIRAPAPGELSAVPYAEPTWLAEGYFSPYYTENHRQFQTAFREFCNGIVYPEAVRCEENGRRISQQVMDKLR